jgi:anti-sigma B factor antagonist
MALDLDRSVTGDRVQIAVSGEVDLYTSPELRSAILEAVETADSEVVVDLAGVKYMDSSGVATLVEGLRSAHQHDKIFKLVAPSPQVTKVLELTRLDSVFEIEPTA